MAAGLLWIFHSAFAEGDSEARIKVLEKKLEDAREEAERMRKLLKKQEDSESKLEAPQDPDAPPEVPRLSGVENEGVYIGTVRPVFQHSSKIFLKAILFLAGKEVPSWRSGKPLFKAGEYRLDLVATRLSNGKTRRKSIYFEIRKPVVAIAQVLTPLKEYEPLAEKARGALQKKLIEANYFQVPDRQRVEAVQNVLASGCTETICAIEIGRGLDADHVISATVIKEKNQPVLLLEVIKVENNSVKYRDKWNLMPDSSLEDNALQSIRRITAQIFEVSPDLFVTASESRERIWKSALVPGWGQYESGNKNRGLSFMAGAGLLFLNGALAYQDFQKRQNEYNKTIGLPAGGSLGNTFLINGFLFNEKKKKVLQAENYYANSLYAFGGLWLASMVDVIYYSGPSGLEDSNSTTSFGGFFWPQFAPDRRATVLLSVGLRLKF